VRSFADIEKKYKHLLVEEDGEKPTSGGSLTINGRDTTATLSSDSWLSAQRDRNGWFDIAVRALDGTKLLMYRCVATDGIGHTHEKKQGRTRVWEETVFPNYVLFGADALSRDRRLNSLSFTMNRFEEFFHFDSIEWQSLGGVGLETMAALRNLRTHNSRGPYGRKPSEYDFFRPMDVYIVHKPVLVFSFTVGDARYRVGTSVSWSSGGSDAPLRAAPVAYIEFSRLVPLDRALDAVESWRRLYTQIAMEEIHLTGLGGRAKRRKYSRADFYIPYLNRPEPRKFNPNAFHAGVSPMGDWGQRHLLANATKAWLQKSDARMRFRLELDHVIKDGSERLDFGHLVALCAGIESLSELNAGSNLAAKDIEAISKVAHAEAKRLNQNLPLSRFQGLMQQLNSHGLNQKLRVLLGHLAPTISIAEAKTLIKAVRELRQVAAHGIGLHEEYHPRLGRTISALTAVCAAFDLLTSGFGSYEEGDRKLLCVSRAKRAIADLDRFETNDR
jgi:hypothetical protein